jgi:hypothetical protein
MPIFRIRMAPDAFATVCRRNEDMDLEDIDLQDMDLQDMDLKDMDLQDMDLAVAGNDADVTRLQTTTTVVFRRTR